MSDEPFFKVGQKLEVISDRLEYMKIFKGTIVEISDYEAVKDYKTTISGTTGGQVTLVLMAMYAFKNCPCSICIGGGIKGRQEASKRHWIDLHLHGDVFKKIMTKEDLEKIEKYRTVQKEELHNMTEAEFDGVLKTLRCL